MTEGRYERENPQFSAHPVSVMVGDVAWFLGIRAVRERSTRKAWLVQDQYIETIAK